MDKKLFFCFMLLGMILLSVSSVSAVVSKDFSLDIEKSTDSLTQYGTITLTERWFIDVFGWFKKETRKLTLKENSESCEENCYAIKEIELLEKGSLIDDVKFETIKEDGSRVEQPIRSYQFYVKIGEKEIEVDDYKWTCTDTGKINKNGTKEQICENKLIGTSIEYTQEWKEYNLGDEFEIGTYEVKLEGQKKPGRSVDWIVKSQGVWIDDWALWENIKYYHIEITATSLNTNGWNETVNITYLGNNVWRLNTTYENNNISKAVIMEDLFYGTDGSNPKILSLVTSPTRIYSSDRKDEGKRATYVAMVCGDGCGGKYYNVTFIEQINNFDVNVWWRKGVGVAGNNPSPPYWINTTFPTGNQIDYVSHSVPYQETISSSLGTDTTNFSASNPNRLDNTIHEEGSASTSLKFLLLNTGNTSVTTDFTGGLVTYKDFHINNSIPLFSSEMVGLNFPMNNSFLLNPVEFNCSGATNTGATLTNMTLWIDGTPNETQTKTGTLNESIWTKVLSEGSHNWTVQACDSDGDCGFADENRTLTIDLTSPTILLKSGNGTQNFGILGLNHTINYTITDTNLQACWIEYNNTNTTIGCNSGLQNSTGLNLILNNYSANLYANDSAGNLAKNNFTWDYKIFQNELVYNSTTYETSSEAYTINVTAGSGLTATSLVYNGTSYAGTQSGQRWTAGIDLAYSQLGNNSAYWRFTYDGDFINSTTFYQNVSQTNWSICDSTYTIPYLNFSFKDDSTNLPLLNVSIDASTWVYYIGNGGNNKTYLYNQPSVINKTYTFCFVPPHETVYVDYTLQYSMDGYPQRRFTDTPTLTNSTTHKTLYLLSTADGTYSTYQVQTSAGSSIQGVSVVVERQFDGVYQVVEQGTTGSDGGVTFWLNPDYDHRLTFSKTGYTNVVTTIRPTQSVYTITMGSGGTSEAAYTASMDKISWIISPKIGQLSPNTNYLFGFNVSVQEGGVMSQCRIRLYNLSSTLLNSTTGCTSTGGNISMYFNTGSNSKIFGEYAINNGSNWIIVDTDAKWYILDLDVSQGNIWSALTRLKNLDEFGTDNIRKEFSRIVIFFFILMIVLCFLAKGGWDFATGGGTIMFLAVIMWMASFPGFLQIDLLSSKVDGGVVFDLIDKYYVALITTFFAAGFYLRKFGGAA